MCTLYQKEFLHVESTVLHIMCQMLLAIDVIYMGVSQRCVD